MSDATSLSQTTSKGLCDVLMGPLERPCGSQFDNASRSPLLWRETGVVRAPRANLSRIIRLVNGLVAALNLRCRGRHPTLIGVLLLERSLRTCRLSLAWCGG
jgi:hypothetical protein